MIRRPPRASRAFRPFLAAAAFALVSAPALAHEFDCARDGANCQAGYEWAQQNDVTDPDDCRGDSKAFIEGCRAWTDEQQADADDEGDDFDATDTLQA